jgi:hypothetical protein
VPLELVDVVAAEAVELATAIAVLNVVGTTVAVLETDLYQNQSLYNPIQGS